MIQAPSLAGYATTAVYATCNDVRDALIALKYKNQPDLAEVLGDRLFAEFCQTSWDPTLITAVPLSLVRLRARGYNQSALLAEVLARATGVPFHRETLRKVVDIPSQTGLRAFHRRLNVAGAFVAEPILARDQRVVLIDDICTTGATLEACANALRKAGASIVWGLTVSGGSNPKQSPPVKRKTLWIR